MLQPQIFANASRKPLHVRGVLCRRGRMEHSLVFKASQVTR
jgi:hypothetical protein